MTVKQVLKELKSHANESTKRTFENHATANDKKPSAAQLWGVKIGDMKKIQKKIKKNHELSLELYDSGIGDAMYFAGLIADEDKITRTQLTKWMKNANWSMVGEYTVPWVAAESKYGWVLGLEWIDSKSENYSTAGWSTLGSLVAITDDAALDIKALSKLLTRVSKEIHKAPNRTRYTMNNFVIALGSYVPALTDRAKRVAKKIGTVHVDQGGTACKVPFAPDYIAKVEQAGRIGKKRKMARC